MKKVKSKTKHPIKRAVSKKKATPAKKAASRKKKETLEGYPHYPVKEDIYNKEEELTGIDLENIYSKKTGVTNAGQPSQPVDRTMNDDLDAITPVDQHASADELDVPGSELDDAEENIGSEDEENNYYSIGGDGHKDLEEDKG
jgi:hypothetical protein